MQRGRDRAERSGEIDFSLDNDEIVLKTAVQAIKILCRFGQRKDAEKAQEICRRMQGWLQEYLAQMPQRVSSFYENDSFFGYSVAPVIVSTSYHALGLNEAMWSRLTFEPAERSGYQTRAVELFQLALDSRWGNAEDLDIHFSWAIVLAEMRDMPAAIKVVKKAIAEPGMRSSASPTFINAAVHDDAEIARANAFVRERKLIPFWHLLALLLTAKSDLKTAFQSCDAAFEQFHDPEILFGQPKEHRSEHLNDKTERQRRGLVDLMERFEKDSVVQVKMTQLALIEQLEGSAIAVESSADLLALYARLFGDPRTETISLQPTRASLKPPKSAVGSIKQILRRTRSRSRVDPDRETRPSTRATTVTVAPTIQVTDEDGSLSRQSRTANRKSHPASSTEADGPSEKVLRPALMRRPSSKLRKRSSSLGRRSEDSSRPHSSMTASEPVPMMDSSGNLMNQSYGDDMRSMGSPPRPSTGTASVAGTDRMSASMDMSMSRSAPNFSHNKLPPASSSGFDFQLRPLGAKQPPQQKDLTPMAPQPRFPDLQQKRHKMSLLVEVWLFISGLYTRAALHEDARGACEEAFNLVQGLENEVAQESSSARAFAEKGWGMGKGVEELWGDVWAEVRILSSHDGYSANNQQRGELARAMKQPFDALAFFEKALAHFPDHSIAVVGLCEILLDIYAQKIPCELPEPSPIPPESAEASRLAKSERDVTGKVENGAVKPAAAAALDSPESLNRMAARDRAYQLLSTLTKLGSGWDNSEAWFALARAYEESGQVDKAKEVLWWCVELEDTRPLRRWGCAGGGGYVL